MITSKIIEIYKEDICNLSRIPFTINNNPCYLTALQIINSNSNLNLKDTALYKHYKSPNIKNTKTLYNFYGVGEILKKYSFDCIFLPWIHKSPIIKYRDVAFIERDDAYIKAQIETLKNLIDSIKNIGYKPDLFLDRRSGNITGYYLKNKNEKKFYVVSGNHRVAVLSALFPDKPIPAIYEKVEFLKSRDRRNRTQQPREIYELKNVNQWPSVNSGFISASVAKDILMVYMGK